MRELIKETFEIWVQTRWLKEISRALDEYNKLCEKASRKRYVIRSLIERYNELYPDSKMDLRRFKNE